MSLTAGGPLAGVPGQLGSFPITVQARDVNGCIGNREYTLVVECPVIGFTPETLSDGVVGTQYDQSLTADGGVEPYRFAKTSGDLPPGLILASDGLITGVPVIPGEFTFTVTVTDDDDCSTSREYTIIIRCATVSFQPTVLPGGDVDVPYSQPVTAQNVTAPVTYYRTAGAYPPGLELLISGVVTGTPTQAGVYAFTVKAVDANECEGEKVYTIAIDCPDITVTPGTLPEGETGIAYSQPLTASGGTAPYTFAVTGGTLPQGLELSAAGVISGTPEAEGSAFTVTATDANGCVGTRSYTLTIAIAPPSIFVSPAQLAGGQVGQAYAATLDASGGEPPYSFAVAAGNLPGGLDLSPAGNLAGTPAAEGTFGFTVAASDANGEQGTRAYTVSVTPPPAAWSSAASDLGSGWRWLSWFGYFNNGSHPWTFHLQHAWLRAFDGANNSVFFWDTEMQAFWWTSPAVYPYVYRFADDAWLYYLKNSDNPRWFYNYQTEQWEQH